jgi:hypothetical protein
MAIDTIPQWPRHKLESAGAIKKGPKAFESMLRNMYAGILITKKVYTMWFNLKG